MKKLKFFLIAACIMFITSAEARSFFMCIRGYGFVVQADDNGQLCCARHAGGCPPGISMVFEVNADEYLLLSDNETDDDVTNHLVQNLDMAAAPPTPEEEAEVITQLEAALNAPGGVPLIYVAGNEFSPEQLSYLNN